MKRRAKICLYVFLVCACCALGILGYFVFNPANDNVMVGSRKFVTFNDVPGATSYSLSVRSSKQNADTNSYIANYKVSKMATSTKNEYSYKIEVSSKTGQPIAEETYTQKITAENVNENTMDCIISNYTVLFFNVDGTVNFSRSFKDQTLKDVNRNIFCCVVSEYFDDLFIEDGNYLITFNACDSEGQIIEDSKQTLNYKYYAYYETDFDRRNNLFIDGQFYDYVITSKEELNKLVYYTILYQKNDVTFYVKTPQINSQNINSYVIDAINSYPEYDGLNDSNVYATMQDNVGKLQNFYYYFPEDFTKTYEDLPDKNILDIAKQQLYVKDADFICDYVKLAPTERHFKIDSEEYNNKEVMVYNSEQLFMATQYGARPIFEEGDSVAKTIYNNAKNILRQINNSDNLTEYQKALNIYNYICNNVIYDYVTYKYMDLKNDFTVTNFGYYSCFHLEGALYDLNNQYAVCDGLSKAYALMCNIEGIKCVKINGQIVDEGEHAWNKVFLPNIENICEEGWYIVDTTWGVATYNKVEVPTHMYFLKTGSEERFIEFQAGVDETPLEIDYYKVEKYSYEVDSQNYFGDFYIEGNDELKQIFDYAEYCLNSGKDNIIIEIEIDDNYLNSIGLLNEFKNIENYQMLPFQPFANDYRAWFTKAGVSNSVACDWLNLLNDNVIIFNFSR